MPALQPYADAGAQVKQAADEYVASVAKAAGITPAIGQSELGSGEIGLSWHPEPTGLHIDATNLRADVIRDFKLWVVDIRKYSDTHKRFVEVALFHEHVPFVELQLWSDTKTQVTQIGGVTKLFSGSPVTFNFLHRDAAAIWFRGRTTDASVEQKKFEAADIGVWEVTLRCEALDRHRNVRLTFEWPEPGRAPKPFSFPQPVSKAPPPITPLRGGGFVFLGTRDANAKDQHFADVLTERYTYAIHNILHWDRLGKGQEFNDDDVREWDAKEREWTSGVLQLLQDHGCNRQMQSTFRDIRDVPFTVRHHFRHVSERLGMFAARLDRLRDIINHCLHNASTN